MNANLLTKYGDMKQKNVGLEDLEIEKVAEQEIENTNISSVPGPDGEVVDLVSEDEEPTIFQDLNFTQKSNVLLQPEGECAKVSVEQLPDDPVVKEALDYIKEQILLKHPHLSHEIIRQIKDENFFGNHTDSIMHYFVSFITHQCAGSSDPFLITKLQKLLLALISNPKHRISEQQVCCLLREFLFPCLLAKVFYNFSHIEVRNILGETLAMFCKSKSSRSDSLINNSYFNNFVSHLNDNINSCSMGTQQWCGILSLVISMGSHAIQSVVVPHRLRLFELIDASFRLCDYTNLKTLTSSKEEFSKLIAYSDASILRAQVLKACSVLLTDVLKEDIFLSISNKTPVSFEPVKRLQKPKPVVRKFDHHSLEAFFTDCFGYFGDALLPHVYCIFSDLEVSNKHKKINMQEAFGLYITGNKYVSNQPKPSVSLWNSSGYLDAII